MLLLNSATEHIEGLIRVSCELWYHPLINFSAEFSTCKVTSITDGKFLGELKFNI